MFINPSELKSAIYQYQVDEITNADTDTVLMSISAAVAEVKAYLRNRYDTDAIFAATGAERDPLLLELTKNIAVWYIIRPCNVDLVVDNARQAYDRAISWLKAVANGSLAPDLPLLTNPDGQVSTPFRTGSRQKFNHE